MTSPFTFWTLNRGPTEQQLKISSDWLLFVLGVGVATESKSES